MWGEAHCVSVIRRVCRIELKSPVAAELDEASFEVGGGEAGGEPGARWAASGKRFGIENDYKDFNPLLTEGEQRIDDSGIGMRQEANQVMSNE